MKFRINVAKLMQLVKPAVDIALKNIKKSDINELFYCAGMLTIEASTDDLCVKAYGGTASIIVRVDKTDGYIPDVNGIVTVRASEVMECLKSFQPTDKLIVSTDDEQLTISLESDPEIFVGLPTLPNNIECPIIPKKSVKKCLVDRAYFVKGLQKIAYAVAVEEKMFTYMCILFESWKNKMRFSAGTGGRFACLTIDGDSHKISDKEASILLPKTNISNVIRTFKDSNQPSIRVRTIEQNSSRRIPEQVVLESGNITLALYGSESFTKYPDLTAFIDHNYSYSISTRMSDWKSAIEAIKASRRSHKSNIHNTDVIADLIQGNFLIRPRTEMKISRKVGFEFGAYEANYSKDKNHKPWFRTNSNHLIEMVQKGYKDGTMIVNFDDQAKLAEIPEGEPKQMKPVVITYPTKTNKDGTREKYSVFFTVSTK